MRKVLVIMVLLALFGSVMSQYEPHRDTKMEMNSSINTTSGFVVNCGESALAGLDTEVHETYQNSYTVCVRVDSFLADADYLRQASVIEFWEFEGWETSGPWRQTDLGFMTTRVNRARGDVALVFVMGDNWIYYVYRALSDVVR